MDFTDTDLAAALADFRLTPHDVGVYARVRDVAGRQPHDVIDVVNMVTGLEALLTPNDACVVEALSPYGVPATAAVYRSIGVLVLFGYLRTTQRPGQAPLVEAPEVEPLAREQATGWGGSTAPWATTTATA